MGRHTTLRTKGPIVDITPQEVAETLSMVSEQNLDLRTITMGISLAGCADEDMRRMCDKVYDRITRTAEKLVETADDLQDEYGIPIANKRVSVTPIAQIAANVLSAQLMLYKAAEDADTMDDLRQLQCSTALVKGYVADLAVATNVLSLNVLASYGVTKEYKVERFVRDSLIAPNIEGSADIQRLIAGGHILRG